MEKRTFLRVGLGLGISMAASVVVQIIFASISYAVLDAAGLAENAAANEITSILSYGMFCATYILVFWLFAHKMPVIKEKTNALTGKQTIGMMAVVFCVGMGATSVLAQVGSYIQYSLHYILTHSEESALFADSAPSISGVLMVCVFAPVCEEILFRKLLIDRLRPFGDIVAILYSGIAFGLYHQNFMQMFYAAALGCLLAYVYLKTNRLWTVIVLHFAVNVTSTLFTLLWHWSDIGLIPFDAASVDVMYIGMQAAFWILAICLIASFRKKVVLLQPQFRFSRPVDGKLVFKNAGTIVFLSVCAVLIFMTLLV